jgi:hypothetical protein
MTRARALLALTALAVCALAATLLAVRTGDRPGPATEPAAAARTSFPDLQPAAGEPELPSLASLHPVPGTTVPASGPFDDRLVLSGRTFDGDAVRGSVQVTSDVSDVLDLQALAGLYDAQGRLVGTARCDHHLGMAAAAIDPLRTAGRASATPFDVA